MVYTYLFYDKKSLTQHGARTVPAGQQTLGSTCLPVPALGLKISSTVNCCLIWCWCVGPIRILRLPQQLLYQHSPYFFLLERKFITYFFLSCEHESGCTCVTVHMCRSEHSFQESFLPFNHLGPRGPTHAIRPGGFFLFLFFFQRETEAWRI